MATLQIHSRHMTDEYLRELTRAGWRIKCPFFIGGVAIFPAIRIAQ